ncbi:MAG: 23S rRNA (uracil(1939)-C(5))-methyltransferase RlmD [Elusimicrobia bacterium]|jgi:23S rRNA (uracil1939-C5)-methyltransferase|nr:23S rRNA (uracil(1939)-C(5))-methyltransferase RlmD [Elusimicrobiota bacterium]
MSTADPRPAMSLCPHFGTGDRPPGIPASACGGCASQDRPYDHQLAHKESLVRRLTDPFLTGEFRPIVPSPDVFHYRNKMEFAFGGLKDEPPLLGLRQKGRFDRVVDLTECRLLSPEAGPLLAAVRGWALAEKWPTYHLKSHRGLLRYLVVREGKNTGERMVALVTAEGEIPKDGFLAALDASGARVDTVVWMVNAGLSDVAHGEERAVWRGRGTIDDRLGKKVFRVSPRSFFQSNTRGAEKLYGIVGDFLGEGADTLFDVYCGGGAIGLCLADRVKQVVGIESNPAAVADALQNARVQEAPNTEFHALDAATFAKTPAWVERWRAPRAVAVMDPPRPGLQPDVRRLLLEQPVSRWVYVSCNPEALARDLAYLAPVYDVKTVQPVDLFPHTPHVETVVRLDLK